MAEKKLNIGNLVTPNGASLLFGAETTPNNLEIVRDNEHTWNPYTIIIDEELDENISANAVDYTPPSGSIITANDVQGAINQLADSLDDVGGAFYATYGVTTPAEINTALENGKNVIARKTDVLQIILERPLVQYTSQVFIFSATTSNTTDVWLLDGSGEWNEVSFGPFIATDDIATTAGKQGITSLSSATNSTAENMAATPKAVKAAYDLAASKGSGTITEIQANGTSIATNDVANIPAATTSSYGVTKLSSSTSSTSTSLAATPSAVKSAYDLANAAMPKSGGAFTGAISGNITTAISSSVGYYRPIRVSMFEPTASDGNTGDIWVVYSNG